MTYNCNVRTVIRMMMMVAVVVVVVLMVVLVVVLVAMSAVKHHPVPLWRFCALEPSTSFQHGRPQAGARGCTCNRWILT